LTNLRKIKMMLLCRSYIDEKIDL